jgi:hypothetical protein
MNMTTKVAALASRIQGLLDKASSTTRSSGEESNTQRILTKRLNHLEKDLYLLVGETDLITGDSDICLLHQYEERMSDMKSELATILQQILALEDGDGALIEKQSELRKLILEKSLKIQQSILGRSKAPACSSSDDTGVKLPKLDVPNFDGNIINWNNFWEQFGISVHGHHNLSNPQKLAYLKHALKDGGQTCC